jgi:hypothetical protein
MDADRAHYAWWQWLAAIAPQRREHREPEPRREPRMIDPAAKKAGAATKLG